MSAPVLRWLCGCGEQGRGEKSAQDHAKTCPKQGYPWTNLDYPRPVDIRLGSPAGVEQNFDMRNETP